MKKFAVALAVLVSMTSSAFAAEGPLLARFRGVYIQNAGRSTTGTTALLPGVNLDKDILRVENKLIPEIDFSFFVTPNVALELILTTPQQLRVRSTGAGALGLLGGPGADLGTVTALPPVLTIQYHVFPGATVNPYVGVGANFTLVTDQDLGPDVKLDKTSFGASFQVGADIKLTEKVSLNLDAKWVQMDFDVKARRDGALGVAAIKEGTKLTTATLNPWLFGVGVGYRF